MVGRWQVADGMESVCGMHLRGVYAAKPLQLAANSVSFSPNGRMLASGGPEGTVPLMGSHADFLRGLIEPTPLTLERLKPNETALLQNYPNPFNPETWIPYQLAEFADVSLGIYSADGTLIRSLMLCASHEPGIYRNLDRAAYSGMAKMMSVNLWRAVSISTH